MERPRGTLPDSTSSPPAGRCWRCGAPLPPRSQPTRRWCSPACGYQAFLDRKAARLAQARDAELLVRLEAIVRLLRAT